MDGDQSLIDLVLDQLTDDDMSDEVVDLILAAHTGDEQLDGVLAGRTVEVPTRDGEGLAYSRIVELEVYAS